MFDSIRSRRAALAGAVLASALIVAACGGSSSESGSASSTSTTRPRTTTTARAASSTTTTAPPNNCTAANLTVSLIPDPNPTSLTIAQTAMTNDGKYAFVRAVLTSGAPSNGVPVFVSCESNNWKFRQGYRGDGMDCSTLTATERAAIAELATKTNAAWNCR